MLKIEGFARGAGIMGVNVEVGDGRSMMISLNKMNALFIKFRFYANNGINLSNSGQSGVGQKSFGCGRGN